MAEVVIELTVDVPEHELGEVCDDCGGRFISHQFECLYSYVEDHLEWPVGQLRFSGGVSGHLRPKEGGAE